MTPQQHILLASNLFWENVIVHIAPSKAHFMFQVAFLNNTYQIAIVKSKDEDTILELWTNFLMEEWNNICGKKDHEFLFDEITIRSCNDGARGF